MSACGAIPQIEYFINATVITWAYMLVMTALRIADADIIFLPCRLLWPPDGIGQAIIFSCSGFYLFLLLSSIFFSSPDLSGRTLDVYHTSTQWCGPSANLERRSETCCARLAENAGPKKSPKIGHLGTIAQLCRAISSQLRHVSTIGKNLLNSNISVTCSHNMVNSAH